MYRPSRLKLLDLNPNLICVLCGGYFVDATTIVECLHSFCKTCIVRYLETSKYCPICDVQVHKTKPLQNIRSDQTLQNIVYKLVPGLFQNEMRQRREFYALHPEVAPVTEYDAGIINEETSYIFSPDETVALCLEYGRPCHNPQVHDASQLSEQHTSSTNKECYQHQQHRRYLRCPAAVTVSHLKKLLRSKYGLSPDHRVDLMYNDELLREDFSLMDVAYVYLWRRKGPMHLTYRIFERPRKRRKLDLDRDKISPALGGTDTVKNSIVGCLGGVQEEVDSKKDIEKFLQNQISSVPELEMRAKALETEKTKSDTKPSSGVEGQDINEEWKEVQLQISENGVMSVRNIDELVSAVEVGVIGGAFNETIISSGKVEESKDDLEKTGLDNAILGEKEGSKLVGKINATDESAVGTSLDKQLNKDSLKDGVAFKSVASIESKDGSASLSAMVPLPKVNVTDKVSGTRVCDVNKHKFSKKESNMKQKETKLKDVSSDFGTSLASSECLPLTNSPQPGALVSSGSMNPCVTLTPLSQHSISSNHPVSAPIPKRPNSSPVGYKTLKTPPKTWNPSIPRASFLANHATFGKTSVGGNVNGNITTPGQSVSSLKLDGRTDGKVSSTNSEGGSGNNNGVRIPPTSSQKPLRFFKMRNNMPRYLGNPSSGVKPMYQVQPGSGTSAAAPVTPKPPLSAAKVDCKVSSAPQLPTSSSMTECKPDKSGSVTSKVAFPMTPSSKCSSKSPSGMNSAPCSSPGQSVPNTFSHTPISSTSATQLPTTRTTQSAPTFSTNTTLASSGYHPSLPASINMIFGPSRPTPNERPSSQTPPPAVQRVPASVHHPHHFHHPHAITPIHLLQHRQVAKTTGKLNGELSGAEVKSLSKSGNNLTNPNAGSLVSDNHKVKEGSSREGAKEPVNGKIDGTSSASKTPPVVEGKSMAPSKC